MSKSRVRSLSIFLTALLMCIATSAIAGNRGIWFDQVFNTGSYNLGIIQDHEGFLWLTTTGGLIRYDGYNQKIFTEGPDGLTSNFVPSVYEDSQGLMWIVTLSGLDLYDEKEGSITHFQPKKDKPGSIGSNIYNWAPKLVTEDHDGGIWIASRNGVYRYDKKTASFKAFKAVAGNPHTLDDNDVWTIITDREGKIWIGTASGLNVYDPATKNFSHYRHHHGKKDSLGKGIVYAVFQDREGVIWVGTSEGGLNRFLPRTRSFLVYTHDQKDPTSIANDEVFSITEDNKGNLWLGRSFSHSVGLEKFNTKTGKFTLYTHHPNTPGSLSGNIILTCFQDKSGTLWVPDNTGPINKFDPYSHRFDLFTSNPENPATSGLSGLTSVYQDSRGDIWLGGQKGLTRRDHTTGKCHPVPVDPKNPKALWNRYAFSVIEGKDGDFWIATDDGYLSLYDREKEMVVKRYLNPFVRNAAREIIEDRSNPDLFWFGVEGYGLFSFNKKTGRFTHLKSDPKSPDALGNDYIYTLTQDKNNIIWVQSQGGLYRFDPQNGHFSRYQHDHNNPHSISSNVVNDIFIDSKGTYWVSTDQGLNRFDPISGKFTSFSQKNGFSTPTIRAIKQDNSGNLWLGSNDGLFAFDPKREKVIEHFTSADGLQGNSFSLYGTSALRTRDGKLWFAGLGGANSFYPKQIHRNINPPPTYIVDISQGGESLIPQLKIEGFHDLNLNWRHNYFEFEYVGLNFSQPTKNQYKYKLQGWDKHWYFAGNKRFGRYSGLTGGTYILQVLASNNDGVWGTKPAELIIHVQTPYWDTWWFYVFAGLSLTGIFSAFYVSRIRQLQKFNKELECAYESVGIAEKKYRSIFKNAVEGIIRVTAQGKLVHANPAAASIMGFDGPVEMQQEINQVRDWMRISQRDWLKLIARLRRKDAVFDYELQAKRKTGELIWLAINIRSIKDEEGNTQYLDGHVEDITIRKKADDQLRLHQEHLEQLVHERTRRYQEINANLQKEIFERERVEEELLRARKLESIGVLAGGIAHDFNNLMTVIMGNINLMQLRPELKDSVELQTAAQALRRAKDLTQKFITFSSGGDPIKKMHDIEQVTRSAVELALSGSNIQAVFSIDHKPWKVSIDQSHISQAVYNIIENSKQAMEQGGTLEVKISTLIKNKVPDTTDLPIDEGDYVLVEFKDHGGGILPEHLPKIFDPYFTTADKGDQKGKGLGLTIAYSIIKKHGGYLFVESNRNEGTRTQILLPAATGQKVEKNTKPSPLSTPTGKKRILMMDDEMMLLDMAKMMLKAIGYEVEVAADGDTAVSLYKQAFEAGSPFHVAILDLTIPGGIGGKEVVKILRKMDPDLKAVVSSGYADDPVVSNYREYGFLDSLSKPYDMQELQSMLSRVIRTTERPDTTPPVT